MATINGDDLFVIARGGRFKCRADQLVNRCQSGDRLVCERNGQRFRVDWSRVLNDDRMDNNDLFPVERGGRRYKLRYSDFRQILTYTVHISSTVERPNVAALFGSVWGSSRPKILVIDPGVVVGSFDPSQVGLTLPGGFGGTFKLVNYGSVQGGGGGPNGGYGGWGLFIDGGAYVSIDNQGNFAGGGGGGALGGYGGRGGNGGTGGPGVFSTCYVPDSSCGSYCASCFSGDSASCNFFQAICNQGCPSGQVCQTKGGPINFGAPLNVQNYGGAGGAGGAGGRGGDGGYGAGFARAQQGGQPGQGGGGGQPGAGPSGPGAGNGGYGGTGGRGADGGAGGNFGDGGAGAGYGATGDPGNQGDGGNQAPGDGGGPGSGGEGPGSPGPSGYSVVGTSRINWINQGALIGPTSG